MKRWLPIALCVLVVGACSTSPLETATSRPGSTECPSSAQQGSLVVLAASSMANVFNSVREDIMSAYPCITSITFGYGSSSTLAAQIVNGAPADVFVSASESTMATVHDAGLAVEPIRFATNKAEIMLYKDSAFVDRVKTLVDLLDSRNEGITVGVCVESAPCGSLADKVLANALTAYGDSSLTRATIVDTETASVEDLVTKVSLGELDAGLVYHSDCVYAQRQNSTRCVAIPDVVGTTVLNAKNSYLAGALNNRDVTRNFVDYLNGKTFQSTIRTTYGFLAP